MPSHHDYKLALQALQAVRLRRDHADLASEPQYHLLAEFFFSEMYGPRDFSARDQQAQRLHQFIHLAPGMGISDVEEVLQLLELTTKLDEAVTTQLLELGAPIDFSEALYEHAYRLADNYADRVRQIELVRSSLYNVHRLANKPLLGLALQRTHGLARATGMGDIHRFLRLGYQAIQTVHDIHRFIGTIYVREMDRLDRIYQAES